jgi:hypothetical protein
MYLFSFPKLKSGPYSSTEFLGARLSKLSVLASKKGGSLYPLDHGNLTSLQLNSGCLYSLISLPLHKGPIAPDVTGSLSCLLYQVIYTPLNKVQVLCPLFSLAPTAWGYLWILTFKVIILRIIPQTAHESQEHVLCYLEPYWLGCLRASPVSSTKMNAVFLPVTVGKLEKCHLRSGSENQLWCQSIFHGWIYLFITSLKF